MKTLSDFHIGDIIDYPMGQISYKSPIEYNEGKLYGEPYIFISSDKLSDNELYYMLELDTKTMKYVLTDISNDFGILFDKASSKNRNLRKKLFPN